jgi:hypothetical protein
MFEIQWRDNPKDKWEPQEEKPTRHEANDWIMEQPDGGMYRVVERDN